MNKVEAAEILKNYTDFMAIQRSILSYNKLSKSGRVHRGTLQRQVAEDLNFIINPKFYTLVQQVIKHLGIRKITVQGIPYYKGLSPRD